MPIRKVVRFLKKVKRVLHSRVGEAQESRKRFLLELLMRLRTSRKKKFGLFVILGWKNQWNRMYADIPDSSQDVFVHHGSNIFEEGAFKKIAETIDFDGAILVHHSGEILHSGIILEGLHPRFVAAKVSRNNGASGDLSSRLGFKRKVHARHLAAIAASYEFPGTTVYTVSEETGDVHMFEGGRIVFSTVPGELL